MDVNKLKQLLRPMIKEMILEEITPLTERIIRESKKIQQNSAPKSNDVLLDQIREITESAVAPLVEKINRLSSGQQSVGSTKPLVNQKVKQQTNALREEYRQQLMEERNKAERNLIPRQPQNVEMMTGLTPIGNSNVSLSDILDDVPTLQEDRMMAEEAMMYSDDGLAEEIAEEYGDMWQKMGIMPGKERG